MKKIVLLSFLLLSACTTSKTVTGPNGEILHHVNCSGSVLTWADCYEKAGKLCPQGYTVENVVGQNYGTTATFNRFGFYASPIISRELFIICK